MEAPRSRSTLRCTTKIAKVSSEIFTNGRSPAPPQSNGSCFPFIGVHRRLGCGDAASGLLYAVDASRYGARWRDCELGSLLAIRPPVSRSCGVRQRGSDSAREFDTLPQ
jgi:hypothetical protein